MSATVSAAAPLAGVYPEAESAAAALSACAALALESAALIRRSRKTCEAAFEELQTELNLAVAVPRNLAAAFVSAADRFSADLEAEAAESYRFAPPPLPEPMDETNTEGAHLWHDAPGLADVPPCDVSEIIAEKAFDEITEQDLKNATEKFSGRNGAKKKPEGRKRRGKR